MNLFSRDYPRFPIVFDSKILVCLVLVELNIEIKYKCEHSCIVFC